MERVEGGVKTQVALKVGVQNALIERMRPESNKCITYFWLLNNSVL